MKISVVVPFYNLAPYVAPCLDSVAAASQSLAQGVTVEVLAVDDGSTDESGACLDAYTAQSFSLRVIHQKNGGEGAARNAGLAAATGDWITFLDGDDVWLSNHLTEAVPLLRACGDAEMVAFAFAPFTDGEAHPASRTGVSRRVDLRMEIPDEIVQDVGVFPTFFRRDFLAEMSFSSLPLGADRLFMAHCFARANALFKSDAVVHGYRVRENSMARAAWNTRKIVSMIDYASGALAAFDASGKVLGRGARNYLMDVLLVVTPKMLRRMTEDATTARLHWRAALSQIPRHFLSFRHRVRLFIRQMKIRGLFS